MSMTRVVGAPLEQLGHQLQFYARSLRWAPRTLHRYRREIWTVLSDVALGSGGMAVVGGTVA